MFSEKIKISKSPGASRSAEMAENIESTENPSAGRSAEIAVNIESSRPGRPAEIAVNLQFRHLWEFQPLGYSAETAENV